MSVEAEFQSAQERVQKLARRPSNEALLELYASYKQATSGDATGSRPGMFDVKARAKYDAWARQRGTGREAAMRAYIDLVAALEAGRRT